MTPKNIKPILGWNISQEIVRTISHNGMHIIKAAMKIAIPTADLRNPPTRGIYPNNVVKGEKNIHIEITIRK